jgi:Flp pilus assembly protein TadG
MDHYRRIRNRSILPCNSGVTTLEFASLVPVLLLLIMGIVEFSLIMFTMSAMESATNLTSRLGKTGYTEPNGSRSEQIIADIKERTADLLDPEKITISPMVYSTLTNVNQPEPYTDSNGNNAYNAGESYTDVNGNGEWDEDMGEAGLGEANDIVVYTVSYPWHVVTPIVSRLIGDPFTIQVRTVVKNEPY